MIYNYICTSLFWHGVYVFPLCHSVDHIGKINVYNFNFFSSYQQFKALMLKIDPDDDDDSDLDMPKKSFQNDSMTPMNTRSLRGNQVGGCITI